MQRLSISLAYLLLWPLVGQVIEPERSANPDFVRVGPGVTAPKVLYKIDPEYSQEARRANVQGTVVFQIVVDQRGRPANISLLSPLGFGLDERAQAAIEQWKFKPGMKDGKPVTVEAQIEVNFRLL